MILRAAVGEAMEAMEAIMGQDFRGRILTFDSAAAGACAAIAAARRAEGPIGHFDCQIAAFARARGTAVATRDVQGFAGCGIEGIDPWHAGAGRGGFRWTARRERPNAGPMRTAIVVPTYDRPEALAACLAALMRLDPGPDAIVVVDDGGARPAAEVCARFGDRVRCLRQENAGPAAARNAGVRAAGADLVALTDDDCAPRPGWLGALMRAQGGVPGRMVGGRVENALTANVYAAASQALCDYLYAAGDAESGGAEFFTTNNVAFDRATFEAIGGFDESFPRAAGEDRDFGRRWRAATGMLVYAPEAVVDHAHGMDLRGFWRQQANYGRGARLLHARMAARTEGDRRFSRTGFYAGLVAHPLRDGHPRPLVRSALLALAQTATAWGYARERPR